MDIKEQVFSRVIKYLEKLTAESWVMLQSFTSDTKFSDIFIETDSINKELYVIEVVIDLEYCFNISIPDTYIDNIRDNQTIGDLTDLVVSLMKHC